MSTLDVPPEAMPLSKEEQEVFDDVTQRLKELGKNGFDDIFLIQFIRGYAHEGENWANAVFEAMKTTLEWRATLGVDSICEKRLEKRAEFKKTWTTVVTGKDPAGRFVQVDFLGKIAPGQLLADFTEQELIMHHIQNQEFLQKMKRAQWKDDMYRIYRIVSVVDMNGIGMGHTSSTFRGPAKALTDIDQAHYPESMQKMYIINTPWVFKMIWKAVRPWLHPVTQQKITVCGSNYLEELAADGISLDNLPKELGGTGVDLLQQFEEQYLAAAERGEHSETTDGEATDQDAEKKKKKKKKAKE